MECILGITTLYSISLIKTLITQHFEIFVRSRWKFNLMRKRNLEMLLKQQKTTQISLEILVKWKTKEKFLNSIQKDRKSMKSIENDGISTHNNVK